MTRTDFELLGDRHKYFEGVTGSKLMSGLPFMVRLDGRAFHTLTQGMDRPYHQPMLDCMRETMIHMVSETSASVGYVQSDEISLMFTADRDALFSGVVQKIVSTMASECSVKFYKEMLKHMPEYAEKPATFDARVIGYPSLDMAIENLVWREADATRNSLTAAAHAHYSTQELHGAGFTKKHDLLHAVGVNWNDYPVHFKRGVYAQTKKRSVELSELQLSMIPEKHRPTGPVMRSVTEILDVPPLQDILSAKSHLFPESVL